MVRLRICFRAWCRHADGLNVGTMRNRKIKDGLLNFSLRNWINDGSVNQIRKERKFRRAMKIKYSFVDILSLYGVKKGSAEKAMGGRGMQGGEKKRGKRLLNKKTEKKNDT